MMRMPKFYRMAYILHAVLFALAGPLGVFTDSQAQQTPGRAKRSASSGDGDGYHTEIVCEARGRGSAEFQSCPKRTCRANVDCWVAYGKPQQCVCDPFFCGLVCLPVESRCPKLIKPENGEIHLQDSKVGDTADYSCSSGFTVMGPRKRHCLATLQWSGPEPVCTNQTDYCFSPPYIPNALVLEGHRLEDSGRTDYRNGESITMTCGPGFFDSERKFASVVCVGNQWRHEVLNCERISCSEINGPSNGRTLYTSDTRFKGTAVQFCNDGFQIKCSSENEDQKKPSSKSCARVCQADGTWSGKNAECIPVTCPKPESPANGFISAYPTKVNSVVAFECAEGYELIGSSFRTCGFDGTWDGKAATCILRDCGPPLDITNAIIQFTATTYGSKAYFNCESGSKSSVASPELSCGQIDNRTTWLPQPYPACHKHCRLPPLANGNITLVRDGSTVADANLLQHGTSITVTCQQGYGLVEGRRALNRGDTVESTCNDGTWSKRFECQPARCTTRPPNIQSGIARFYSLHHGSVVRYQCFAGYQLDTNLTEAALRRHAAASGASTASSWALMHDRYSVKCEFGSWNGEVPTCVQLRCSRPNVTSDLQIYLVGEKGKWPFDEDKQIHPRHGERVVFSCKSGDHRIEGSQVAFCVEGNWKPVESPRCVRRTHDVIPEEWLFYKP